MIRAYRLFFLPLLRRNRKCVTTPEIPIDLKLRSQARDVEYSKDEEYVKFSDDAVA